MSTHQLIVVGAAIFVAAFMQVVAGFGFALLSMPIMTLAVPVRQAIVVSTLLGMISTTWQAWHLREDTDQPLVKRYTLAAFVGMPIGLVALNVVSDRSLRLVLGGAVIIATILLISRINLREVGRWFDLVIGFVSGILNTSLSTNGPPLVFGLQARHLDAPRFRATISTIFAYSNIVGITLFALNGKITADGLKASAIAMPAWVIGQALGWPVRKKFHGERFRTLVLVLLFVAGTSTLLYALFK
jgi:uncharacterized membrane protein YfcA